MARHFVCTAACVLPPLPSRALIADGDLTTRLLVSRHLTSDGFRITECRDGREAFERISADQFDLIVLDAALPGLDGIALCRAIRQSPANCHAAIFVVGASAAEQDAVLALANGADDYLAKPPSIREFLARVSAVMRRTGRPTDGAALPPVHHRDLLLDPAKRDVVVRGARISCSRQEFDLLYGLASAPGIVFTRDDLLARHWPQGSEHGTRLVDPIVSRLRRKVERDPDNPELILTVWGVGYKFRE